MGWLGSDKGARERSTKAPDSFNAAASSAEAATTVALVADVVDKQAANVCSSTQAAKQDLAKSESATRDFMCLAGLTCGVATAAVACTGRYYLRIRPAQQFVRRYLLHADAAAAYLERFPGQPCSGGCAACAACCRRHGAVQPRAERLHSFAATNGRERRSTCCSSRKEERYAGRHWFRGYGCSGQRHTRPKLTTLGGACGGDDRALRAVQ